MMYKGKYVLNSHNEIRIGREVYSKDDLTMMFLDRRNTIQQVADGLEIGRGKAYRILKWAGASTNRFSELCPTRLRVLRFVVKFIRRQKQAPLLIEIAEGLEMRVGNVHHHLTRLKKAGYLTWTTKHRSIKLLKNMDHLVPRRSLGALYHRRKG